MAYVSDVIQWLMYLMSFNGFQPNKECVKVQAMQIKSADFRYSQVTKDPPSIVSYHML